MAQTTALQTDYLVVGAGTVGMSFVDTLIERSDADVVMVDRHYRPGGHWIDSYPFVQLHQPSRFYGVDSTPLGHDRIGSEGTDTNIHGRASGFEICGYYDEIMRDRFLESDRVRFFPMSDYLGDRRFRSRVTGTVTDVDVHRKVVDATYGAPSVPITSAAPFAVDDAVQCVPVNELAALEDAPAGYVVVGGGKTAADAICWLLDRGTDPSDITWIRPQDSWMLNRACFQPADPRTLSAVVTQLESAIESETIDEVYERFEDDGLVLRTDASITPTMMKGATISRAECDQLAQVERVVRMGHVQRIASDRIELDGGTIDTSIRHLHVHCAAGGLSRNPPRPIFTEDTITPQLVDRVAISLSAGLVGVLESTSRTAAAKNALCPATGQPHTPFDWVRSVVAGLAIEVAWLGDALDLFEWVDGTRLNLLHGLPEQDDAFDIPALQNRFLAAVGPAVEKLQTFAAQATPQERALMGPPPGAVA